MKRDQRSETRADVGLLALRTALGGSLAAHGAQKLFGSFGGRGLEGTGRMFESKFGLAPGPLMAGLAGLGESGGGALIAAGLGGPIGPAAVAATLAVAARTAHAGKPYFAQEGGPELPVMDIAAAVALAATGFGRFSVDRALRVSYSRTIRFAVAGAAIAGASAVIAQAHRVQRRRHAPSSPATEPVTAGSLALERVRQATG